MLDATRQVANLSFVIRKVAYQYQYIAGQYRMVSKAASVKKTSRDSVEKFMERLLPKEDVDETVLDDVQMKQ